MSYNILAGLYVDDKFEYCPSFALEFSYRFERLIGIIVENDPDIFALQELVPEVLSDIRKALPDYDSRYEKRHGRPDGCAIFFKAKKWKAIRKTRIEFNDICDFPEIKNLHNKSDNFRHCNIGVVILLETIEVGSDLPKRFWVTNIHYYWNPNYSEVKLMQAYYTTRRLERIFKDYSTSFPLFLLGDFNSTPDSNVYEYFSKGTVAKKRTPQPYSNCFNFNHTLKLKSAYEIIQSPVTNITPGFTGCIDYIWYTPSFTLVGLVGGVNTDGFLPNPIEPSDHCFLLAKFISQK